MLTNIFRMAMHGSISLVRLDQAHTALMNEPVVMLVHRQGSDGEILTLSELANIEPCLHLPEELIPTTSLVGLRSVSSDPSIPHFLLLRDLPKDFAPIGRFRPARGLVVLRSFGERVAISAWGADDPGKLHDPPRCWSFELLSVPWVGEMQFGEDLPIRPN